MDGQGLPRFKGDVCIQMITHIKPNWNISDFHELDYSLATHPALVDRYLEAGHNKEKLSIYNYHESKPMPKCMEYIRGQFHFWDKVCIAVNHFKPGQYLPIHVDLYTKFIEMTGAEPKNVMRCIVMLEDSQPGQIIQIDDECHGKWKAGDCFYWRYNTPHAFYNMSTVSRYAVQVTGITK